MLDITLTPTALWFNNLSEDELIKLGSIYSDFEFKQTNKGVYVPGNSAKLYKLLLDLTYKYDVELR